MFLKQYHLSFKIKFKFRNRTSRIIKQEQIQCCMDPLTIVTITLFEIQKHIQVAKVLLLETRFNTVHTMHFQMLLFHVRNRTPAISKERRECITVLL